jgi:AmmeMemoRadiSam system protein A
MPLNIPFEAGAVVVPIARGAIGRLLGVVMEIDESAPWLQEPGATFVTVCCAGKLRGCIGTLEPHRALLEDVKANAVAAALHDRRFAPLRPAEWPATRVEVSVLSALEAMLFEHEGDALEQLRPGLDGVVFACGTLHSTFLPQVWETLPEPRRFLAQLKRKAGVDEVFWSEEVKLWRYRVEKFTEQ